MARPVPAPEPDKNPTAPAADPGAGAPGLDRALQAALIESRQRLRELVDLSCDFAWETDAKGRFSFITGQGTLGRAGADLLGTDPANLTLSPEDAVHFQSDSPPEGALVWARAAHGAPVCLHLKARAIFDAQGEFLCVRGACRDVTEAQERDAALAAAKHRERSMVQLFRALREAADPKAAIKLGVETSAQATGAAGAALFAADTHGIGAPLAQTGPKCRRARRNKPCATSRSRRGVSAANACWRFQASIVAASIACWSWRARPISPTGRRMINSC